MRSTTALVSAIVERAAKKLAGVTAATADQPKGIAEITFDRSKISPEEIAESLTRQSGFTTELKEPTKKSPRASSRRTPASSAHPRR
jgi:copper chaperone CopZ